MNSTDEKHSVSIVIPVYYAEQTIKRLVDELVASLSGLYSLEIVLVNDCSKDSSEEICLALFHEYPHMISFYSLAKNVGEHNAVMAGLNHACGDYVVIMDDDFQNPIREVINLVSFAVAHDYDVVYTYYEKKEHSLFRNMGSRFNDLIATIMLKKPKDLYLSSFKLLRKNLVAEIIKYDLPYPYIDGLVLRTSESIGKLKVQHDPRKEGKSGYTLRKLVSLWLNMFTSFSVIPLRFATLLGFLFAGVGFIMGVVSVIERFLNPGLPAGYTFMFVFFAVISGIQLIAIGMLGEYIGRIFISINKGPQYTIRKAYRAGKIDSG
ncbi:MAG: glycosyltransferase family 2 protein [Chloroflexi bacterium]|nr:glycosyltransferase family 2 protein [Chloroflexota bacterium]